jgi:GntR family transcriptional regulator / MocR family aminotransferase
MTFHTLDSSSPVPLYRQLRAELARAIAAGQFGTGRLPASRVLASELGLSRNTVNLAYQELMAEGYVSARPRSGLFVNPEMQQLLAREHGEELQSGPPTAPALDWSTRITPVTTADSPPHVDKPRDWHRYPYVFLGGQMGLLETFPARAWLNALRTALEPPNHWFSLQDSQDTDDPMLVERLCAEVLPARGITANADQVLITCGSQHGLYLLAQALIKPLSVVAVEEPGYPDTRHIMLRAGARLVPIPVDESGLVLTPALRSAPLIYVTPSHQFPTNVTLSIARRRDLLDLAGSAGAIIVEDDYDSEFRYQGRPAPALKALDRTDRVVYLGSFSKFLAPGLRLGFIVAASELIRDLRDRRRYMIRHVSGHQQRALALLIESGEYIRAIRRSRGIMKAKWQQLVIACREELGWQSSHPAGGTSVWLTGPDGLDSRELTEAARRAGVLVEAGDTFFLARSGRDNHLRLGFTAVPRDRIHEGIALLGRLAREQLGG